MLPLLLDALAAGQITVRFGRIDGCAGWLSYSTRTIVLNPDASPERLEAQLVYDLEALASPAVDRPPEPLRLIEGGRSTPPDDTTPPAAEPRVAE